MLEKGAPSTAIPEEIQEALSHPTKLVLWLGAGVSADSGLPLGDDLVDQILRSVFSERVVGPLNADLTDRIYQLYRYLFCHLSNTSRAMPRLEFVLERIVDILYEDTIDDILRLFGLPNHASSHQWLANQAAKGAQVITGNFDMLIEAAGAPSESVFHYHGTYLDGASGAVLRGIAQGLSETTTQRLDSILAEAQFVIFLGYSGRDYYDIVPYFRSRPYTGQTALWVLHDSNIHGLQVKETIPPHLNCFSQYFHSFRLFTGESHALYGRDQHCTQLSWHDHVNGVFDNHSPTELQTLALDLLARLGLDNLALEVLDHIKTQDLVYPTEHKRILLEKAILRTLHNASKYKSLLKRIRNFHPPSSYTTVWQYIRRQYRASSVLYSFSVIRAFFVAVRARALLPEARRANNQGSACPEFFLAAHEEIHAVFQFLRAVQGFGISRVPFIGSMLQRRIMGYRQARANLHQLYMENIESHQFPYDEELAQSLREEARTDYDHQITTELAVRWEETDNLKKALIVRRFELRDSIQQQEQPSTDEIIKGIAWAYRTHNHYELLFWLALGDVHVSDQRRLWRHLRGIALSQIELGPLARRLLLMRARQHALYGL